MYWDTCNRFSKSSVSFLCPHGQPTDRDLRGDDILDEEEEMATGKCMTCMTRTLRPFGYRGPSGASKQKRKRPKQPSTMSWDDFVNAITFQAKTKPVMSRPQQ